MPTLEKDKRMIQTFGLPEDIDLCSFNCLGFATGLFTWLPKGDLKSESNDLLIRDVMKAINDLSPGRVRLIKEEKELRENEYLCVVFLETERDFMHVVRREKGRWVEKDGHKPISYLPKDKDPLIDVNCSWSKLSESCSHPQKYLLAVDKTCPVRDYVYMSDTPVYCCLKIDLLCETYEIYDVPYGVHFYNTKELALARTLGTGKYLWKLKLMNCDKPIKRAAPEQGILFNDETYMLEILKVQQEDEDTYCIEAKPVLTEDIQFEETVTIPLEGALRDCLPKQYSPVSAFLE